MQAERKAAFLYRSVSWLSEQDVEETEGKREPRAIYRRRYASAHAASRSSPGYSLPGNGIISEVSHTLRTTRFRW